ncbi:unnamed protein product [Rotaria sordida]|uniref:Enkurin domain-containing protein n=1 Tax=Rotaria sordida TaxID=392033 RepID=A0A815L965_9BILA|nr:unnamed protein product [Rotaria sordida]CAF1403517.1 unnamed protein product [Rotaria sordida]CAF3516095.1 unnamed protein product [Rotaria sordida]CAF3753226.1 unnamed protein product [Rotaria sordida]
MYLSQQPFQWSAQFGPSLTNSYDQPHHYDSGTKNLEGPSLLRSPIPPDPGYGKDTRVPSDAYRFSRPVRLHGSDAKIIYKRAIANDGAPFRLDVHCSKCFPKPPKNHLNENFKRIRRIMRDTQQRQTNKEQSKQTPMKVLRQSKQYDHIQSKVKQKLEEDTQRSLSRPQSAQGNFLRAHENTGPQHLRSQSACISRQGSVGSSVNLATTQADNKTKLDYVKLNSRYVKTIPKVRKTISEEAVEQVQGKREKELKTYQENQNGLVPNYIEKIKEKRDQDAYQTFVNTPDPDCPLGHVKVDNNQRVSTLAQLQSNRVELEKKLGHLPIRNDTVTLRRTKEYIEKKIVELDEAIQIFSKPKVFIKMDE